MPHPLAPRTLRQREMAWYQLFFQFEGNRGSVGYSTMTGRCYGSYSEATVMSIVTSLICHGQML
jgi:hypothetical protein